MKFIQYCGYFNWNINWNISKYSFYLFGTILCCVSYNIYSLKILYLFSCQFPGTDVLSWMDPGALLYPVLVWVGVVVTEILKILTVGLFWYRRWVITWKYEAGGGVLLSGIKCEGLTCEVLEVDGGLSIFWVKKLNLFDPGYLKLDVFHYAGAAPWSCV